MQVSEKELNTILNMITSMASLDFSKNIPFSGKNDEMAAIAEGLNMLSEELNTQVVTKDELNKINQKLIKFAHVTAHDLKTPVNASSGLIELIEMSIGSEGNDDLQLYLSKLKEVNENLRNLISGILEYSKSTQLNNNNEKVDFNKVLQQVIELDKINNNAEIIVKQTLPTIPFNKTAANQIFINLIDNAIKYSDKKRCKIIVHCLELENLFQFKVEDNGPGISIEHHEPIFEEFNQVNLNEKQNSVGIGLATVKGIVESAGGRIWVESELGEGTTFIFTLKK